MLSVCMGKMGFSSYLKNTLKHVEKDIHKKVFHIFRLHKSLICVNFERGLLKYYKIYDFKTTI